MVFSIHKRQQAMQEHMRTPITGFLKCRALYYMLKHSEIHFLWRAHCGLKDAAVASYGTRIVIIYEYLCNILHSAYIWHGTFTAGMCGQLMRAEWDCAQNIDTNRASVPACYILPLHSEKLTELMLQRTFSDLRLARNIKSYSSHGCLAVEFM